MTDTLRYIWQLLVLSSLLVLLGILLFPRIGIQLSLTHYLITVGVVTGINLLAWIVMWSGIQRSNREGVVVILGGIGLKFLLYLLFILLFWVVTKNLSKPFIITFFALYLLFTFLLAGRLLKLLKNK